MHIKTPAFSEIHLGEGSFDPFGGSDSRFLREKGILAYGVFPVLVSMADIQRVHGSDENISVENMIRGTAMLRDIVRKLCSI